MAYKLVALALILAAVIVLGQRLISEESSPTIGIRPVSKSGSPSASATAEPAQQRRASPPKQITPTAAVGSEVTLPPTAPVTGANETPETGRTDMALTLFGTVTDSSGLPLEEVLVGDESFNYQTMTNRSGKYRLPISSITRQSITIRFLKSGYAEFRQGFSTRRLDDKRAVSLDASLDESNQTVTFAGSVKDEQGLPMQGRRVIILARRLARRYSGLTGAGGQFRLIGVQQGNYDMTVLAGSNHRRHSVYSLKISSSSPELDIVVDPVEWSSLSLRVFDRLGNAMPNLPITVLSDLAPDKPQRFNLDEFGQISSQKIPAGRLTLSTQTGGHFRISGIIAEPLQELYLDINLDIGSYYYAGRILNQNSNPVAGAAVSITRSNSDDGDLVYWSWRRADTSEHGEFSIAGMTSGEYKVKVVADGYRIESRVVSLNNTSRTDQINLLPKPAGRAATQ